MVYLHISVSAVFLIIQHAGAYWLHLSRCEEEGACELLALDLQNVC